MPWAISAVPTVSPLVGHSTRIRAALTDAQRTRLHLILQGLRNAGATHSGGLMVTHEYDAIRWLLENGAVT